MEKARDLMMNTNEIYHALGVGPAVLAFGETVLSGLKERFAAIGAYLNGKYGEGTFTTEVKDTYYNMKEIILPRMEIVNTAKEAMADLGIDPVITPIRGGTDGAMLSYMGLPCPNLCTGGCLCHSRYEFVSVPHMRKCVQLLIRILEKNIA